jgi:hypothetical protein
MFWNTLPGVLTGIAAIVSAATGLYLATSTDNTKKPEPQPTPPGPSVVDTGTTVSPNSAFRLEAVINDPDGYVNIRSEKNPNSPVIGRVNEGSVFYTHRQQGQWWRIKTADGIVGFMHASRIHLCSQP